MPIGAPVRLGTPVLTLCRVVRLCGDYQIQISALSYEDGKAKRYRATEMESGSGCMVSNLRPAPVRLVIGSGIEKAEALRALRDFMGEINGLEAGLAQGEAELRKNAAERLRVSVHEFNGHDMLSVRVYVGQDVDQAKPTQKGITVNVVTLPKLISLLQEAEAKARAEGLLS